MKRLAKSTLDLLFNIIKHNPAKTFNFAYTFNNAPSSPFFPSARYEKNGFAVGMQPTDLAANTTSLEQWLQNMKDCWQELANLFADEPDFLGIDNSVAPIEDGDSSFVHFIKRLGLTFERSTTTNFYTTIPASLKRTTPSLWAYAD